MQELRRSRARSLLRSTMVHLCMWSASTAPFGKRQGAQLALEDGAPAQVAGVTSPVLLSFHDTKLQDINRPSPTKAFPLKLEAANDLKAGEIARAACNMRSNTAWTGTKIESYAFGHDRNNANFADEPADCCVICSLEPQCRGWTFSKPSTKRYHLDDIKGAESGALCDYASPCVLINALPRSNR